MARKAIVTLVAAAAMAVAAGTAAAALAPWTFVGSGATCPVTSTFSNGVLHLEKNCATTTNASAGASITGIAGQTLSSASFTLASASQCQGGSPRFNVVTTSGSTSTTYFLGCNNVTPTINADGTATYAFTPATIAAAGNQVPFPAGTISTVDVLIDVQGTADLSTITVNGVTEVPVPTTTSTSPARLCKAELASLGRAAFDQKYGTNHNKSNAFGKCVSAMAHQRHHGHGG
jgi:hypothetical protein